MNDRYLSEYLTDHLAGAVAAIQLIEGCRDRNPAGPLHDALSELLVEVKEDYRVLQDIESRVAGIDNPLKKLTTWLAIRLSRLKLQGFFFQYTDLTRLEELEGLVIGIRGKLALWTSLEAAAGSNERFDDVDFGHLQKRARQQLDLVKDHHRQAAIQALAE